MGGCDYLNMDPHLLYSLVNTRLRNEFDGPESLAEDWGLDSESLVQRLAAGGFRYLPEVNQFRPSTHSG